MSKIYIPTEKTEDWKRFLASETHWREGYSAYTLAHCWEDANGFPQEIADVISKKQEFADPEMLIGIPELKVPLPGGKADSQNDIWVLGKCSDGLFSIAVEGKVDESLGRTIEEWNWKASDGKEKRLKDLCKLLEFEFPPQAELRYQLFHRTASALIMAKEYCAKYAIMLIHSFSQTGKSFNDYVNFGICLGITEQIEKNEIYKVGNRYDLGLYIGWIQGKEKYLTALE